jgi:hypothetical protein
MESLIANIRNALTPLKGEPIWDAGRAATMLWLQIGKRVHAPTTQDPQRVTGEYAVHVQCPWRVSSRQGIVVGSADIFRPADRSTPGWDFDPSNPGNAAADLELRRWIGMFESRPLVIAAVDVDPCGGFRLRLSEGFIFEVFPDSSESGDEVEHWRLLKPAEETRHFVLRGRSAATE